MSRSLQTCMEMRLTRLKAERLNVQWQQRILLQGLDNDVFQFWGISILVPFLVRLLRNDGIVAKLGLSIKDHSVTYRHVLQADGRSKPQSRKWDFWYTNKDYPDLILNGRSNGNMCASRSAHRNPKTRISLKPGTFSSTRLSCWEKRKKI